MVLNMNEYARMINDLNISIIYSGPMWEDGIKGIAEMVKVNLSHDNLSGNTAKSIFSVFVEQITNMLMYSAEKGQYQTNKELINVPMGMLVLGQKDDMCFIQTRNAVRSEKTEYLKNKIDYLNTLNKKELRQYQKEMVQSENDNPDSKGAGLGLIVIARRASAPIEYKFEQANDGLTYFTMYVEVSLSKQEEK
ncbi:MAG: SiaB family protein kinase [Chitinivibrionia bacterium]|nr:SiaB family protein kinase [Chitinivibrionia bacterium]